MNESGVVYTRKWVVGMMLDLIGYTAASDTPLAERHIVEPSCGEGSFLRGIVMRLCEDSRKRHIPWDALGSAISAYDIDEGAVEDSVQLCISILREYGCDPQQAEKLTAAWVHCDDFLLTSEKRSADYVVGNPPYVRAANMDCEKLDAYVANVPSMTRGADLYVAFIDRSIDLLKEGGRLVFICADRWLQNRYGTKLRGKVQNEGTISLLIRMYGVDAFLEQVDAYPSIMLFRKGSLSVHEEIRYVDCSPTFHPTDVSELLRALETREGGTYGTFTVGTLPPMNDYKLPLPLGSQADVDFIMRAQRLPSLEETGVQLGIGIATGCDEVFITEDPEVVEPSRMLPLFYMRDYRRGRQDRRRWLINPWDTDGTLVDLDEYPRLKEYYLHHEHRLRQRHVARSNPHAWYRTIDKVHADLMKQELLLFPDMAAEADPILSYGKYPHHNCYWLRSDAWDLHVLGGLLMSDAIRRFIDCLGVKMRGGTLRFQAQYLRLLHLPEPGMLSEDIRENLAQAFAKRDRKQATYYADQLYQEVI